ncbi:MULTISPECIES: SCO family protein [Oleiagrimonas]|jgi:protein SCO1|uniref:SCO family protein n=1 Tax=Oleiagrimonas citrea TaxID=1665687 RepID=A0A846ZJA6_9GAMM|nr:MULTISPECIES: SCO family protein [Oleiagrimonas]NKZ37882.1 SCO family protein [Oleiagrimonas citrea]RAP57386.1 SCO family protein [Oleiagrimonas sp. MCCC 1A03011]
MNSPRLPLRRAGLLTGLIATLLAAALLAGCHSAPKLKFRLTDVTGHLPDLKFQLTDDDGQTVTAKHYRGKVTMLYFGYTHCPDVCPLTLTRIHVVMQRLGKLADGARFLFVTVDPARDTVPVLHQYVTAFDKHAVGLTGTRAQIRALAKRYRAAFDRGKQAKNGGYEVNHSSAIYIFDRQGRARVLATPATSNDDLVHDLHLLLNTGD